MALDTLKRFAVASFALLAVLGWSEDASASHFRHGTVQWRVPNPETAPLTVEFTVTSSWRASLVGGTGLQFGDGVGDPRITGTVIGSGIDLDGNAYTTTQYVVSHTYATTGPFTAFFASCCRVSGLQNGAGDGFRVQAVVELSGGNKVPPATQSQALVHMQNGAVRTHDFPISEPDGDPTTCRLATPVESGLSEDQEDPTVPNGGAMPTLTTVGNVCRITWDLTLAVSGQQYVLHSILESTHLGHTSATALDVIVEITSAPIPSCTGTGLVNLNVGVPFSQPLIATDDPLRTMTLGVIGLPTGATLTPAAGTSGMTPLATVLDWTPAAGDAGTSSFAVVTFTNDLNITGNCTLALFVQPVCGNGVTEVGEDCDDGNGVNTDACPDGIAGTCDTASCGDGFLQNAAEVCDDGNADNGDGCDSSCRLESELADADMDGVLDSDECPAPGSPFQPDTCLDTDDDGTPNFMDPDDDGDGIDTADENYDGDEDPTNQDSDNDGTPDYLDTDDDDDGIDTEDERAASDAVGDDDVDGDGDSNWLDTDSDADGVPDGDEAIDSNDNGVPDYLEPPGAGASIGGGLTGGSIGCSMKPAPPVSDAHGAGWLVLGLLGLAVRRRRR